MIICLTDGWVASHHVLFSGLIEHYVIFYLSDYMEHYAVFLVTVKITCSITPCSICQVTWSITTCSICLSDYMDHQAHVLFVRLHGPLSPCSIADLTEHRCMFYLLSIMTCSIIRFSRIVLKVIDLCIHVFQCLFVCMCLYICLFVYLFVVCCIFVCMFQCCF